MKSNNTTIVVLDYKSAEKTVTYVKHLVDKIKGNYNIVIVDNSVDADNSIYIYSELQLDVRKEDGEKDLYHGKLNDVNIYLYISSKNGGYACGNNIGASIAKLLDSDYIIFSNNDIKIVDTILELDDFLKPFENDDIGVVGPQIFGNDGEKQTPYKFVTFSKRWILYPLVYPLNRVFKFWRFNDDTIDCDASIEAFRVMGSFLAVRRKYFEDINGFDESTFLYGEEMILSERMRRIGAKTYYLDKIKLIHEHDMTIGKYYDSCKKVSLQYKSEYYFYKEYMKTNFFLLLISKLCIILLVFKLRLVGTIVGRK